MLSPALTSRPATWPVFRYPSHAAFASGARLRSYRFDKYRTTRGDDEPAAGQGELVVRSPAGAAAAQDWDGDWKAVAEGVKFARDLVTEPANAVWPEEFVARTRAAFAGKANVSIEVLDVPARLPEGMAGMSRLHELLAEHLGEHPLRPAQGAHRDGRDGEEGGE